MKKKLAAGICLVLILALLIPIPMTLKDGGTKVYQAVLYRVEFVHRLAPISENGQGYQTGLVVKILGMEVFNNVKEPELVSDDPGRSVSGGGVQPLSETGAHTHLPAETDGTLGHEFGGYCGNTLTTVTYAAISPDEEPWEVTFWGDDSVALTDLLRFLDYSENPCDCLPEYKVDTEFGAGYGVSLRESYARYGDGQASLTAEQVEQIREILERQREQA